MKAIFKREVKSYFTGMIGWVVAAVSLFFLGLYYTNRNLLYASSDFASVLYTMTMILLSCCRPSVCAALRRSARTAPTSRC